MHSLWTEISSIGTGERAIRSFGLLVGSVLLVLGVLLQDHRAASVTLIVAGALLLVLGPVAPRLLTLPYRVWMGLALVLGYVMTRVLLAAVYFLIVTPLGMAMRLSGRDPMQRKRSAERTTYWSPRESEGDARERLERLY